MTVENETYEGPKQAVEAADMAIELHGQIFPTEEALPVVETPAVETPVTPPAVEAAPPVETPVVETPVTPVEPTPAVEPTVDWEARYKSLKGKYDAEVPRLHSDLKEFKQVVFDRIGDPAQAATPDVPVPTQEDTARAERIAKFKEEYGEEYVGMLRDFMMSEVTPLLGDAVEPVQRQVETVEDAQQHAATENFVNHLNTNIVNANWQKAWSGEDPDFLVFLDQKDPSGFYTYGELADLFNTNWDAEKLVTLFNTYYSSKGEQPVIVDPAIPEIPAVVTPAVTPAVPASPEVPVVAVIPPVETPATPVVATPSPTQEALIAPSRTTPHVIPEAGAEPIIWTQASMRQFESDDRAGKYPAEQSTALWNDLLLAPTQNRMRG